MLLDLMEVGLPLMKNVLTPLAKNVLPPLWEQKQYQPQVYKKNISIRDDSINNFKQRNR